MNKVSAIRKACKITDKIFSNIIAHFSEFKTEKDIEKFFNKQCREFGVRRSFKPIIAIGRNAVEIHHFATNARLSRGGFLVLDMGVRVDGFCSDMTRTVHVGTASAEERKLYDLVLRCQKKSCQMVKPGVNCADVDVNARVLLGPYKKYFVHGLGHGVTRRIHDKPSFKPRSQDVISLGDVVTIEPGIYLPKRLGIRIEDTMVVTKSGVEILTKTPKTLLTLPK